MSTNWCPKCRSEYREGFTVCADCGVALVESLPPRAGQRATKGEHQCSGPFLRGDDVVELAQLPVVEAELVAAQLRGAGVPAVVFGTGAEIYTGVRQARVMVRRSDVVDGEQLLARLAEDQRSEMSISDAALGELSEESPVGRDPAPGAV